MKFAKSLFTAAALVATSYTGAIAADLPARVPAIAPAPILIASNWTGFYVGGNVGYGCCGDDKVQAIRTQPAFAVLSGVYANLKPSGVFGGLQAGYNMQYSNFVLGLEIDGQISAMRDSFSVNPIPGLVNPSTGRSNIDWFVTARSRLGYLVTPNTLVYGTGGLAVGGINYNVSILSPGFVAPSVSMGGNYTAIGWTAGAGIEHKFSQNWSLKAEYLYLGFQKKTFEAPVIPLNGIAFRTNATPNAHTVRIGLNYHFSSAAGPVVAKY